MKIVTERELRELVGEAEALEAVENAFHALALGRVTQPPPLGMEVSEFRGEVHVKGAFLQGEEVFAIKVASGFYDNPSKGLPTGSGLVLVFESETGFPLALLQDNGYLTELRTGGAGALAVRLLAPDKPLSLGILGAGSQARYQARAISQVRPFREVRIWSPVQDEMDTYAREMAPWLGVPVTGAPSPEVAVAEADLVVTVTPSRTPLLPAEWLPEGVTIVAVGSDGPEKQELAVEVLGGAAKVVVDSRAQCLRLGETHHAVEAGVLSPEEIHAELGEILVGARSGRTGSERIVVDLTGVGAQDAAMAGIAWRRFKKSCEAEVEP
jgi:ornithine cyclodeaminase